MRTDAPDPVAQALADALLAEGDWTSESLVTAAARVLGSRRRWLPALAAHVLAECPRPPRDAPRHLAGVAGAAPPFVRARERAQRRGHPLRARRHPVVPTRAGGSRWPTARLDDVGDVARLLDLDVGHLDWMADVRSLQRRARPGRLHLHGYRWLERPGRAPRLLEVPTPRLRRVQRVVLDEVLAGVPAHPAAHGFVPGRGVLSGARPHVGADVVVSADLSSFFAAVTAGRVYRVLRALGHPEAVAHVLTGLCTHRAPVRVLAAMPPGGSDVARSALRRALASPHLPQGAPTSPHLANLAAHRLDVRLDSYARACGAAYTRYADDLALSGGPDVARRAGALLDGVRRVVHDEGYRLNEAKTRVQPRSRRQQVTGVVVNDRPGVGRREVDALRALLHNCVVRGPASQDREGRGQGLRAHLEGRVSWVEHVSPGRGAALRAELDRITW
ncbi:reverse transcriptase family protein [uncultured Pseudokineococcus sp.]|uniref:reverse transcriptase family protein n=1 Tax=uncultured Pseudokineococcus sp. TaxID=1642928 RepID=UPI00261A23EC|nr:reverse transcriptase family protein [uncultured Pseudokineococcus sp.]